jgi:cbb3-type cytochrome oxidase cytochrome c subunit
MNQGPLIFLGAFAALALSWFGLIVQPQMQLGRATPGTNVINAAETYPGARSGLAQQGLEVYRSLGCSSCHSQQVRQEGTLFNVVLTKPGTNLAEVVEAIHRLEGLSTPAAGKLVSTLPATIRAGLRDKLEADALAKALELGGAKVEVQLLAQGPDLERGWGRGRTVAADFLMDAVVMPGSLRLGPDLANVGARLPLAEWHYRHLLDPRSTVPGSVMPPSPFLFEKRPAGSPRSADAFSRLPSGSVAAAVLTGSRTNFVSGSGEGAADAALAGVEWYEPTDAARALVAYLLSLKAEVALLERPLASAPASATSALGAGGPASSAGSAASVTNR